VLQWAQEVVRVPLYEYQCPKCGRFELIQKFSDAPLSKCPTCGSEVQKLLSAPAIQFKGTGWDGKDGKGEASKSEGTKSEGTKDSGSGESKPAAAAASKDSGGTSKT
jgi:putative FmdB family regulatory protein